MPTQEEKIMENIVISLIERSEEDLAFYVLTDLLKNESISLLLLAKLGMALKERVRNERIYMSRQQHSLLSKSWKTLIAAAIYEKIRIGTSKQYQNNGVGGSQIAREIPALNFDIEKEEHKGWFIWTITKQLKKEGKIKQVAPGKGFRVV